MCTYVFSILNLKQLYLGKCFAQFGKKVFKQIAIMLKVTTFLCQYELAMQSCTNRQSNLVWISSFFIIPRCNLEWAGQIKSVCKKKYLDLLPHSISVNGKKNAFRSSPLYRSVWHPQRSPKATILYRDFRGNSKIPSKDNF